MEISQTTSNATAMTTTATATTATTTTATTPPEPVVLPLNSDSGVFIEDLASVPIDADFREFLRHVSFDGFFASNQGFSEWLLPEPTSSDGGAAASSDYTTVICETQGAASEACSAPLRC